MPVVNSYINDTQLYHDLKGMDRTNFSYDGTKALMEYLNQLADECEMNIEYDPVAFCCEYSEYDNFAELQESYTDIDSFDDLEQVTQVIFINTPYDQDAPFIIADY